MTPLARVLAVVESAKDGSSLDGNPQEVWWREQEKNFPAIRTHFPRGRIGCTSRALGNKNLDSQEDSFQFFPFKMARTVYQARLSSTKVITFLGLDNPATARIFCPRAFIRQYLRA
jgi:hypothetical protein